MGRAQSEKWVKSCLEHHVEFLALGVAREAVARGALEVVALLNRSVDREHVAHHHKIDPLPRARRDAVQAKEAAEQREAVVHEVAVVLGQRREEEGGLPFRARLEHETVVRRVEEE